MSRESGDCRETRVSWAVEFRTAAGNPQPTISIARHRVSKRTRLVMV